MFNNRYSSLFTLIIIIIILMSLNLDKFSGQTNQVIPVWSSQDENYYQNSSEQNILQKIRSSLSPENIVYRLTRIRLNVPITYLKREIPLLGYYTPQELKEPSRTVYREDKDNNSSIIQLKFDLRNIDESKNQTQEENRAENASPEESRTQKRSETDSRHQPVIAIYHTHTSETYIDDPREQDNNGHVLPGNIGNIARAGAELAKVLAEKYHFKVIHTTKIHDKDYTRAYYNSRQTVKELIKEYPDLDMLLDVHRDGVAVQGKEAYTTVLNGQKMARVMIVVTNGTFKFANLDLQDYHQQWQKNLNFARQLGARLEEMYPGLLKEIEIRDTTYNQDLHPGALLLEIGDYKNTTDEAIRSARLVADVIASLLLS